MKEKHKKRKFQTYFYFLKANTEILIYLFAIGLCSLLIFIFLNISDSNLSVPFGYYGDSLHKSNEVKTMIDSGWLFHNPYLGAPFGYDRLDFPRFDSLNYLIMKGFLIFTNDYAVVINLYYILSFIFSAVSALFVFKQFKLSNTIAFYGAVIFAFIPYPFFRGIAHVTNAAYYMIPLAVMVLIWTSLGDFFKENNKISKKKIFATFVISFLTPLQMPYNGVFMALLAPIAGLFGFLKTKNIRVLFVVGLIWLAIASSFTLEQLPRLHYQATSGVNLNVAKRLPVESELYSLRLSQLILPHHGHRIDRIAQLKNQFNSNFLHINENSTSYLGIWGVIGFVFLLFFVVFSQSKNLHFFYLDKTPVASLFASLSALNIAIFSYATFAGFSAVFAFFFESKIRATNRISVYIAFISIFAFCLILEIIRQNFKEKNKFLVHLFLLVLFVVGILDQTSPKLAPNHAELKNLYEHDRQYFSLIEERLPENAAVFQMPYVFYPEHKKLYSMDGYEHLKAYFHTSTLRWSYGSARGRQGYYWSLDLAQSSPDELIRRLGNFGFSAIYIDKFGFDDGAKSLIEQLSKLLSQEPLVSKNDRYATFFLPKSNIANPPYLAEPYQLGDPIDFSSNGNSMAFYSLGWALPEAWGTGTVGKDARLVMQLNNSVPLGDLLLSAKVQAFVNNAHPQLDVNVLINGEQVGQWTFVHGKNNGGKREVIIPADLITKQNPLEIRFQMPNAKSPAELGISGDERKLGIQMRELRLSDVGSKEG